MERNADGKIGRKCSISEKITVVRSCDLWVVLDRQRNTVDTSVSNGSYARENKRPSRIARWDDIYICARCHEINFRYDEIFLFDCPIHTPLAYANCSYAINVNSSASFSSHFQNRRSFSAWNTLRTPNRSSLAKPHRAPYRMFRVLAIKEKRNVE